MLESFNLAFAFGLYSPPGSVRLRPIEARLLLFQHGRAYDQGPLPFTISAQTH